MCVVENFTNILFSRLTISENKCVSAIIKKHYDNLEECGEFSFPLPIEPWKRYLTKSDAFGNIKSILNLPYPEANSFEAACDLLVEDSALWPLKLKRYKIIGDRVYLFIDRASCIEKCFLYLNNNFETAKPSAEKRVLFTGEDGDLSDISHYRLDLLLKVAKKLATLNGYEVAKEDGESVKYRVNFTSNSSKAKPSNKFVILCAPALNGKSGLKETEFKTEEYLEKRTIDMKLKAQHKYRVVVTDEEAWNKSLMELGKASANFDLLQVKHSHSVHINMFDGGTGCSKGVSFILYNSARLASIINTFRENVRKGTYLPLPPINALDFGLLNDEDEWKIIFNFILMYNMILKSSFTLEPGKCIISPHQLCSYLSSLVGRFSMYYRRIKILMEPREHLLPKIYVRMHLLKAIQDIIINILSIFDITILTEM